MHAACNKRVTDGRGAFRRYQYIAALCPIAVCRVKEQGHLTKQLVLIGLAKVDDYREGEGRRR